MSAAVVYVVGSGERGEGTAPVAAANSLTGAFKAAADWFNVREFAQEGDGEWMASINHVDQVWIHRVPLAGAP